MAVDLPPGPGVRDSYDYAVPEDLAPRVAVGVRVEVPFGRSKRLGYVVGLKTAPEVEGVREVLAVVDPEPRFGSELLALARWMGRYYLCPLGSALRAVAGPAAARGAPGAAALVAGEVTAEVRSPRAAAVLAYVRAHPGCRPAEVAAATGASREVIRRLVRRGLLQQVAAVPAGDPPGGTVPPALTPHQERAVAAVCEALEARSYRIFLLQGVTGAGKTEVYLRAVERVLRLGRQALVLVPEIALTPLLVDLFRQRFGCAVALLHSGLAAGERYAEWERVRRGRAPVVLGARSAVFAPLPDPGLIVVDEEHEPAYKQEETPRYHAREVALVRARQAGAVVVLGSATPSLESYARAAVGEPYRVLQLPSRVSGRPLPRVHVVDMREEFRAGRVGLFSRRLRELVADRLGAGEQVLLFLNRRGLATTVLCRECGTVLRCPRCGIALTYHSNRVLRCHYCGFGRPAPRACGRCGGRHLGYLGHGTQTVEEEVRRLFPEARVLRLDRDTAGRRGAHGAILRAFRDREADVLVGTQMVAKGLDLPGVTLVGVVDADRSLHLPDFRAAERTFQLLVQVAGRAGRGGAPGEVVVQTHSPDHYAIVFGAAQNYAAFAARELSVRRELNYPPYTSLIRVVLGDKNPARVEAAAADLREALLEAGARPEAVLGPAPAVPARLAGMHRWQVMLRGPRPEIREACRAGLAVWYGRAGRVLRLAVDVDPVTMT
ncbi:MAG: primosomal protein N' [Firmicutes bacterium]|nr:primosomal protein N' [Bacillota bacterium]